MARTVYSVGEALRERGKISPELQAALGRVREWERTATPEQLAEMQEAQRQSFIRAFSPCEHGDYDWETCPQCLDAFAARHPNQERDNV